MNNTFTSCAPICLNICDQNNQNCTKETIEYSTADYFCLEDFNESEIFGKKHIGLHIFKIKSFDKLQNYIHLCSQTHKNCN